MVRPAALSTEERARLSDADEAPPDATDHSTRCPACGAELAEDQEWCVECGSARTQIHAPPDWKVGLAIVLGVIAIVAVLAAVLWP